MLAWDDFVQKLEKDFGKETIDRWVRTLKVVRFDARNLVLEALDAFQIAWFEEHIRPRIKLGFANNNHTPIRVSIAAPHAGPKNSIERQNNFSIAPNRLDPEYTFANFVSSSENAMVFKLLSEIDHSPFNPIFLFGPKNSGKTHLLTAVSHYLQNLGRKVFFVKAETFVSHVVQAIRLGNMQQFRKIYREIDALLVDGIDVFAKKDATQEEFFHTFNTLHMAGKQIVLTASAPPSQIEEIEPRLLSRFDWGISMGLTVAPIQQVLEKKILLWGLPYSPHLLQWIAATFPTNPLLAVQALSIRAKGLFNLQPEKAKEILHDLFLQEQEKKPSAEKIIKAIADHFGVTAEDLTGKSQVREVVYPRQIAMYLCREKLSMPYQAIGKAFSRDHSTVMSSIKLIQKQASDKTPTLLDVLRYF